MQLLPGPALAAVIAEPEIKTQIARDALYASYIERQNKDVEALRKDEDVQFDAGFDFSAIDGLSNELKVKLMHARPLNMAQAARIDGMTPSALALLLVRVRKGHKVKAG